jgi:hypothetical protein
MLSAVPLLALGILTFYAAWRGHLSGEILAGGLRSYRPNRWDNPGRFHFYLGLYFVFGTVWTVWGLLICMGFLKPLPRR